MRYLKSSALTFSLLSLTANMIHAQTSAERIIITPQCLLENTHYSVLAKKQDLALISISQTHINELIKNKKLNPHCGGFKDVTIAWRHHTTDASHFLTQQTTPAFASTAAFKIKYQKEVNAVLQNLTPNDLWSDLTKLTTLREDRYADSDNGVVTAYYIKKYAEALASDNNRKDVTISTLDTDGYMQPSVIVKVGDSKKPAVIISAHMDTVEHSSTSRPGADDDGSGSVTVLEAMRLLFASGYTFTNPIYFIWYAAEEEGLVGSQQVVEEFQNKKIKVAGVLHFDLTGYAHQNDPTIWLMEDNTDEKLNKFLASIIKTYVKRPIKYTACGYACSDHASWHDAGYKSTIAAEAKMEYTNPYIHSSQDTMDKLSLEHMTDYAKIATAFAIELAEPTQK